MLGSEHKLEFGRVLESGSQEFVPCLGNEYGVLKLGRPLPVRSDGCPVVRPGDVFVHSCVYHGLNGEHVARLHEPGGFVVRVVRHIGGHMKLLPDPVPAVGLIHCQTALINCYPFY